MGGGWVLEHVATMSNLIASCLELSYRWRLCSMNTINNVDYTRILQYECFSTLMRALHCYIITFWENLIGMKE